MYGEHSEGRQRVGQRNRHFKEYDKTLGERMKVLNLYAGIGGNRKLWEDVEVIAVEMNPKIAAIYQDFFPDDKVVVGDAHQYLLDHFKEFDFIWSSPPCPTHSDIRRMRVDVGDVLPVYPSMGLYQEIILMMYFMKHGKWVVENVKPYYEPLIRATELDRHLFWSNFFITQRDFSKEHRIRHIKSSSTVYGFDVSNSNIPNKVQALRNMVNPEVGLHILNESKRVIQPELFT